MEGHELASLWPHPWPWRQVFSEPKRCAHLQPTHPRPHLDQDSRISCLLTGSAQASSLSWSSQGQTTPSLFITLVPRHSQRAAAWKVYGLKYPHMYTGKARSLNWEEVLGLEAGSFFAFCHVLQQNVRESENSLSDFDLGTYKVLFVKVGNGTALSISLIYTL